MEFSVIVATYNRRKYLEKCLQSLFEMTTDFDYEIIVVNDGSSDDTAVYLKSISRSNFKFLNQDHGGMSVARNAALRIASGKIIAFTDDDCEVDVNWLSQLHKSFGASQIKMVIGQTFYVKRGYRAHFPEKIVQNLKAAWPMTSNIAYRRDVFKKIGLFDSQFFCNEDTELAYRFLQAGYRYARNAEAVVNHQKTVWTANSLIRSAHNLSFWPQIKKRYPRVYSQSIWQPPQLMGFIVAPLDYIFVLTLPLSWPLLFIRYLYLNRGRHIKLFFLKWPLLLILRRYYLWRAAVKNGVLLI